MASFSEVPLTSAQHDISIAEISIFSIPLVIRVMQTVLRPVEGDNRSILGKIIGDGVTLFCLVRIIGGALYLAASSPTDSVLIGALILESLGSTFLLGELTRLLIGYLNRPRLHSMEPHRILRYCIQGLRIPILIAIALFIAAYNIDSVSTYKDLVESGAIILVAVYLATVGLYAYMWFNFRQLVGQGKKSFLLAAVALPFLLVRVLYLVLSAFRVDHGAFVVIFGNWKIFVGMSLVMEIVVTACLIASGIAAAGHAVYHDASSEVGEPKGEQVKYGSR